MASTKRKSFHLKEWLPQKGTASLKGAAFNKKNVFHWNEWLPLKGKPCTKRVVFL